MTNRVVSVRPSDKLGKAAEIMLKNSFSQLPVVNEKGKPVGSITERAVMVAMKTTRIGDSTVTVADIMSYPFPVVNLKTNVSTIRNVLMDEPAVLVSGDTRGPIIGIVTKFELIKSART